MSQHHEGATEAIQTGLIPCLRMILSPDQSVRHQGEAELQRGMKMPGFGVALAMLSLGTESQLDIGVRQLALVILRHLVREYWMDTSESENGGMVVRADDKMKIREVLPRGLGDVSSQIQTATGLVMAEIAKAESLNDWPELLPGLIGVIQSNSDGNLVRGSLRAICLMIEDLDQQHVLEISAMVLPRMVEVMISSQTSSIEKRQALVVLHSGIDAIETMYRSMPVARQVLKHQIAMWLEGVTHVLSLQLDGQNVDGWGVAFMALKCMVQIVPLGSQLPDMSHLLRAVQTLWRFQAVLNGLYCMYVLEDAVIEGCASDEPMMEPVDLKDLVSQFLELMVTIMSYSSLKKVVESSLGDVCEAAVGYMLIAYDDIDRCSDNCNGFLGDSDDWGPRGSGRFLVDVITGEYSVKGAHAMATVLEKKMLESKQAFQEGSSLFWRPLEAALLAYGDISEQLLEGKAASLTRKSDSVLNPNNVLQLLMKDPCFSETKSPILMARLFWVAGRYSRSLESQTRGLLMETIARCLGSAVKPAVYAGIFQGFASLVKECDNEEIQGLIDPMLQFLCGMLSKATDDTLHLLLETVQAVAVRDPQSVLQYSGRLVPICMHAWIDNFNDPILGEDAFVLLKTMITSPGGFEIMRSACIPTLEVVLGSEKAAPLLVSGAIDLLVVSMSSSSEEEAMKVAMHFYNPCLEILQSVDDDEVMASVSAFLRTIFQISGSQAFKWFQVSPDSVLETQIQVLDYLLRDETPDRGCRYAGGLAMELIRSLPNDDVRSQFLPKMLSSIASKLHIAEEPSAVQSLLSVIAHLARLNTILCIDILSNAVHRSSQSLFKITMDKWVERHIEIRTPYDIRLSIVGLGSIAVCAHPAIDALYVKGKRIDTAKAIRTRSKSSIMKEEWSTVPLRVKIGILLVDSYIESLSQISRVHQDQDDEWEEINSEDDSEEEEEEDGANYYGDSSLGIGFSMYGEFLGAPDDEYDPDLADVDMLEKKRRESDSLNTLDIQEYIRSVFQSMERTQPNVFQQVLDTCTDIQLEHIKGMA